MPRSRHKEPRSLRQDKKNETERMEGNLDTLPHAGHVRIISTATELGGPLHICEEVTEI